MRACFGKVPVFALVLHLRIGFFGSFVLDF